MRPARGFTLIELLVVVSIIGLVASIILVNLNVVRAKGRDAERRSELAELKKALELYYDDHGSYPLGPASGVYQEANCGASAAAANWYPTTGYTGTSAWIPNLAPTYISTLPSDPGVNPSITRCFTYGSDATGQSYVIWDHQANETYPMRATDPMLRLIAPSCMSLEATFTIYGGAYKQCN